MSFKLHPQLEQDCIEVGHFTLCRLLIMNDSQYPWFIMVPERTNISEIHQLSIAEQHQLIDESSYLTGNLSRIYQADKMNVATLGNIVSQLHLHHIVRYQTDKTWPGPVWGQHNPVPYTNDELDKKLHLLRNNLTRCSFF
jgi:diadenosine tetraphosphate (Ap4A) HIT family hydrolase